MRLQHVRVGVRHLVVEGARVWVLGSHMEAHRMLEATPEERGRVSHLVLGSLHDASELVWSARFFDFDNAPDPGHDRDHGLACRSTAERVVRAILGEHVMLMPAGGERPRIDPIRPRLPDEPRYEPPAPLDPDRRVKLKETMWYELRLVDERGVPVEDVTLSLSVSGSPRRLTTDADGRVRIDDGTTGFAMAWIPDIVPLRDALRPRWEQIRDGEWLAEASEHTYMDCADPLPMLRVQSERLHTIVVQPRVICARLLELLFDTNKTFLLPSALRYIRSVRRLYDERPRATVLIVGHADTTGEPSVNDPLSLERAKSVRAYLCDDVDAWLGYYEPQVAAKARWGIKEDKIMLDAVLAESGEALTDTPLRHFQATRGLVVDGVLGPNTRRAIITEYMAVDGTSLPAGIDPVVHGCGESFPLEEGEAAQGRDRRVELFFFDEALGVLPPPPGEISAPESREYPEWRRRSAQTHTFRVRSEEHLSDLHFALTTRSGGAPLPHVALEVALPTGKTPLATDDEGVVLMEAIPPGDYEIAVRIGDREDRLFVPTVPPGLEALLIPIDLSLGA